MPIHARSRLGKAVLPRRLTFVPVPFAEMEQLLLSRVEVTESDLKQLADQRASQIRQFLAEKGQVASDRLAIVQPAAPSSAEPLSRVSLQLR